MTTSKSYRDSFGEELIRLGEENPDIVVLTADLPDSTRVMGFGKKFPERFFNIGVAEQNLIGLAAGFANEGFIPIVTSYAVFSPGRNWEQIRDTICYSNLHVIIIGAHAGLSASVYGATHTGLEDIALTRVLPNMTVIAPADAEQTSSALRAAIEHPGPIYIRFPRHETPPIYSAGTPFDIHRADVLKAGADITIIASGPMVHESLEAVKELNNRPSSSPISVEIINISTIKPLDAKTIVQSAQKTGRVITVEDHQVACGMGSAVAEILSEYCPVPLRRIGVSDSFSESGNSSEIYKKFGLHKDHIVKVVLEMLK